MEKKLKVGDWDIKVYCQKHQTLGKKKVQKIKQTKEGPVYGCTNILLSEEDELLMHKVETRLARNKTDFENA